MINTGLESGNRLAKRVANKYLQNVYCFFKNQNSTLYEKYPSDYVSCFTLSEYFQYFEFFLLSSVDFSPVGRNKGVTTGGGAENMRSKRGLGGPMVLPCIFYKPMGTK